MFLLKILRFADLRTPGCDLGSPNHFLSVIDFEDGPKRARGGCKRKYEQADSAQNDRRRRLNFRRYHRFANLVGVNLANG
jgi:hypothetical protein